MEERKCLYCGEPLIGRVDKKFCCDSCRNSYNYEKTHKQINVVRFESPNGKPKWQHLGCETYYMNVIIEKQLANSFKI